MTIHREKHLDLLTSHGKTKERTSRKSNRQTVGVKTTLFRQKVFLVLYHITSMLFEG